MSRQLQEIELIERKFLKRLEIVNYNSSHGLDQTCDLIHDCLLEMGMDQLATVIDNVLRMAIKAKIDDIREDPWLVLR